MAFLEQPQGEDDNIISDDASDHSSMYDDAVDDISNVNPLTETKGALPHDINQINIPNSNDMNNPNASELGFAFEPGATKGPPPPINHSNNNGCKSITTPPLPTEEEESHLYAENAYIDSIRFAISALRHEITRSEEERKESEDSIERQFGEIMERILNKKLDLIEEMNTFYDIQRERSLVRITELTQELGQKEIEKQDRIDRHRNNSKLLESVNRQNSDGFIDVGVTDPDSINEHDQNEENENENGNVDGDDDEKKEIEDPDSNSLHDSNSTFATTLATTGKRLSFFGNKIKKAANMAISQLDGIALFRSKNAPKKLNEAWYWTHDKIRVFMPRKELMKLIETEIKISSEWWNVEAINELVFHIDSDDAMCWRRNHGGWFNAFGSIKVRKGQNKRWNLRILDNDQNTTDFNASKSASSHSRSRSHDSYPGNAVYPGSGRRAMKISNVMVGVVESDKVKVQDKDGGFWIKGMDGYALSASDGKIFHRKGKGKAYGVPFSTGSVVGIELDMMITPGKDLGPKSKIPASAIEGGTLKFYVNGQDLGIAYYGLDLDKEYSLAVAMDGNAVSLQIIE